MTFSSLLTGLIAAAIAIPALVSLYFLKLRRRQVVFPSTLLWRKTIHDMQVNAPFQKLRRNLLLLLQLLILAALLMAMTGPEIQGSADPGRRIVILIDRSASMNSDDGGATRLEQAKQTALELIENVGASGDDEDDGVGAAMIVTFAETARAAQTFTSNPQDLERAVQAITPTDQLSQLAPALRLIEPHARQANENDGESMSVYVISDGRVHVPPDTNLALPGAEMQYVRIGDTSPDGVDNVGFVSFSARRDYDNPERVQVFARLTNAADRPVQTQVQLRAADQLLSEQAVTVPAATMTNPQRGDDEPPAYTPGTQSVQFDFSLPGSTLVSVQHDHDDMLRADNEARLTLAPARRLRALLVTEGNSFLERALRSAGVREMEVKSPDAYEQADPDELQRGGWESASANTSSAQGFDVIVFDDYAPSRVPRADSVYFNAVPPIDELALHPARADDPEVQVILDWQRDHPLMRYVVMDNVILSAPGRLAVPTDGRILATSQSGPIMATVRRAGAQHIVASFSVLDTNWPMQIGFPVFMKNVMQTVGLGALADDAGVSFRVGEIASIPASGQDQGRTFTYRGADTLTSTPAENGEALLPRFEQAGLYVATDDDVAPPYDQLAVNLLDTTESHIRPVEQLEVGTTKVQGQSSEQISRRDIWPWFVWGALAVLMVEWLVYTRRMHV